jgi:hypothetical protein
MNAEGPSPFDPTKPEKSYGCARCGSWNTEVIGASQLWCLDCRNITTPEEHATWLDKGKIDPAALDAFFDEALSASRSE